MQYLTLFFIVSVFILEVFSKSASGAREARMFWRTYTETQVRTDIITSILPASCVHVEPTLPSCRGLRNLETFPEFVGREIHPKHIKGRELVQQPQVLNNNQQQLATQNETKAVGWAEYLGLVGHTITVTEIHLRTTTVIDPHTVVTFSVKGCKPSRLPMELDRCPVNQFNVDEIVPSSVVLPSITPTASPATLPINEERRPKNVGIEPSSFDTVVENLSFIPTEDLSDVSLKKRSS